MSLEMADTPPHRAKPDFSAFRLATDVLFPFKWAGPAEEWREGGIPVGKGAYGRVTRWIRRNEDGQIEDEVAVKEADQGDEDTVEGGETGLSLEAVLHSQLNEVGCESIVHLRSFKLVNTTWRYYLEYAPYGHLDRLRERYKAFNTYLPEVFLWHLFHSLARATCAMATTGHWRRLLRGGIQEQYPDGWNMIHFDIKQANILVSKEVQLKDELGATGLTWSFPGIKLADFGLAMITGESDKDNPSDCFWRGTRYWAPPVSP